MSVLDDKVKQFRQLLDQTIGDFLLLFGQAAIEAGSKSVASDDQLRKIFIATVKMGDRCRIPADKVGDSIWDPRNTGNHAHINKLIWRHATAENPIYPETHQWIKDALIQVCQDSPENVLQVRREIIDANL